MSIVQVQEVLKNMSGDELAQAQNAIVLAPNLPHADRAAAMTLISNEIHLRQTEGLGRKAERFWNRHGQTVAAVAIGAVLGCVIDDEASDALLATHTQPSGR